ncbi:MAG: hypothetical protein JKY34_06615 [Kordiimonadaceae bacterium]|nr:hypothetical protein [Kordiimonadaceae bacterium]
MRSWSLFFFVSFLMLIWAAPAVAQSGETDPRQIALDIYSGINRATPEATIAIKLRQVISIFRYRCTRVTDYQVFSLRPNLTDLKVKCSGDSLYGVTVASNGFVTVYGGNGMLSGLDRRDALIYSFSSEGDLAQDSRITMEQALDDTATRFELGDQYNYLYLLGMFVMIVAAAILGFLVWLRIWRSKAGRKPRARYKPMKKHRVAPSTTQKDVMLAESQEVAKYIHRHPTGLLIAIGKRGKRRFFKSMFWALVYARIGIRAFEAAAGNPASDVPDPK